MLVPTYSRMPKGPYIFSGSLAFTKALGRIGGMGDGVTGVLDLQFIVDLCQLLFVCIETLTNIFIKTSCLRVYLCLLELHAVLGEIFEV